MNLYRLDPPAAIDPLWRRLNHTNTGPGAIQAAKRRAKRLDCDVVVSKIDGKTLRVTVARIVSPDGKVSKP